MIIVGPLRKHASVDDKGNVCLNPKQVEFYKRELNRRGPIFLSNEPPIESRNKYCESYIIVNNETLRELIANNQPLNNLITTLVTDMSNLFKEIRFGENEYWDITTWDVSNVTNMNNMFNGSLFDQEIGNWNVSKVVNMRSMFEYSIFNQSIENWNVGSVATMRSMFRGSKFNQPIGNWDIGSLENTSRMFWSARFNQPIGLWKMNKVKNADQMFAISEFNFSIDEWNLDAIESMEFIFKDSAYNQSAENFIEKTKEILKTTDLEKIKNYLGLS